MVSVLKKKSLNMAFMCIFLSSLYLDVLGHRIRIFLEKIKEKMKKFFFKKT